MQGPAASVRAVGGTGVLTLLPSEAEFRAGVVAPRL
jgi:hypothetical protein